MTPTRDGSAELDRAECLRRLAEAGVGRVSTTVAALPVQNAVVAFEIDDIDPWSTTGWSIVVVGHAREITRPDQIARAERLPLNRWQHGGAAETILRMSSEVIDGRTFGAACEVAQG